MADLFLSYSPQDAETAHKIAKSLEQRGSSIYYQRSEELDAASLQTLDHEMSLASWIIVLWSGNALQDGRITYEAMYAKDKNNLLSVQLQPNSIPADYNNAHSPDHVSYQNQLTSIIQQTLNPEPAPEPKPEPAAEIQNPEKQAAASTATDTVAPAQKEATKETVAPQKKVAETTVSKEQATVAVTPTKQETANPETSTQPKGAEQSQNAQPAVKEAVNTKPETIKQETVAKVQTEQPVQPVQQKDIPQPQVEAENSPRENLQKKLAETTQTSQPVKKESAPDNKLGQPPAPKADVALKVRPVPEADAKRQLKPLPVKSKSPAKVEAQPQVLATTAPQQPISNAAMAAAQPASTTSKLVPIALISVGSILLGSLGAGYWYLANNKPHTASAVSKTTLIKSDPAPVKVAVVAPPPAPEPIAQPQKVQPKQTAPSAEPPKPKGIVSVEDDPLLSSIIQRIPNQQAQQTDPTPAQPTAAIKPAGQKAVASGTERAENMVIQASATRGGKSVSQCQGCHTFKKNGSNRTGPNLYGVMNQLIGSERKFSYSDTLRSMGAIGEVWSKNQLDCYLKNPAVCMPGTKMSFHGVKSQKKRADIIAYLETLQN